MVLMANLSTFGAVMSFAIQLESESEAFYTEAEVAASDETLRERCQQMARAAAKNARALEQARRENVAEMILEPITDFESDDYALAPGFERLATGETTAAGADLEGTLARFFEVAADKIPIVEVCRRLGKLARRHAQNQADWEAFAATG
jgi:hypothetical protein